jgi:hypothetical protein
VFRFRQVLLCMLRVLNALERREVKRQKDGAGA